ncbi:MAG: nicotinate (nicotinamide) nucleotide adenylyltransferase [Candidatus Dormibacteraeota bacterium]|nr:nicotinate (nicotinamide) nucleotide adenylyltransferase [Candidatus Dormibacteraeota bacterium]
MKRIVLFGGTFDPVQTGHVAVADQAVRALQPDEFWFLVDNIPGERKPVHASASLRLEMVRAAVHDDPRFTVSDIEIRRGGATYTGETMDELRAEQPATRFELLLGADSARTIRAWRYGDRLLRDEWFVIVNRSGEAPLSLEEASSLGYAPERVRLLEVDAPHVSASAVRQRVMRGESLGGYVPEAVAEIIGREGLYAQRSVRA